MNIHWRTQYVCTENENISKYFWYKCHIKSKIGVKYSIFRKINQSIIFFTNTKMYNTRDNIK